MGSSLHNNRGKVPYLLTPGLSTLSGPTVPREKRYSGSEKISPRTFVTSTLSWDMKTEVSGTKRWNQLAREQRNLI